MEILKDNIGHSQECLLVQTFRPWLFIQLLLRPGTQGLFKTTGIARLSVGLPILVACGPFSAASFPRCLVAPSFEFFLVRAYALTHVNRFSKIHNRREATFGVWFGR